MERLDARTIGRVRGSTRNTYTAGVICEKVGALRRAHPPSRPPAPSAPARRAEGLGPVRADLVGRGARSGRGGVRREGGPPRPRDGLAVLLRGHDGAGPARRHQPPAPRHAATPAGSRRSASRCPTPAGSPGTGAKRGVDLREVGEHSDLVVIWGGNPVNTQVNVMTHVTRAQRRGATLVVVDPYRTGTAERADVHLALRPGTDGALACAVMHVLFAEGYADWPTTCARYTDAPDELAAHLRTRTPAWAAEITGLTVEQIVEFARLYGRTKRSFIRCHHGFSRSRNGAAQMHAVSCLPAVTGAWQHPGGGALYGQTAIYPARPQPHRGPRPRGPDDPRARPVAARADPDRRSRGAPGRAAGHRDARPEHESRDGVPGAPPGAPGPRAGGPLPLRPRAVPDRDGGLRGHRAPRDHVPRARRLLHRERPHVLPGRAEGRRAAGGVPGEPLRHLRARPPARGRASRASG